MGIAVVQATRRSFQTREVTHDCDYVCVRVIVCVCVIVCVTSVWIAWCRQHQYSVYILRQPHCSNICCCWYKTTTHHSCLPVSIAASLATFGLIPASHQRIAGEWWQRLGHTESQFSLVQIADTADNLCIVFFICPGNVARGECVGEGEGEGCGCSPGIVVFCNSGFGVCGLEDYLNI